MTATGTSIGACASAQRRQFTNTIQPRVLRYNDANGAGHRWIDGQRSGGEVHLSNNSQLAAIGWQPQSGAGRRSHQHAVADYDEYRELDREDRAALTRASCFSTSSMSDRRRCLRAARAACVAFSCGRTSPDRGIHMAGTSLASTYWAIFNTCTAQTAQ